MVWQFSSEFTDNERDRVERLTARLSYGEIVDAIVATSIVVPGSIIWKQRDKAPTDAHRIQFMVDADRDAVDALFNSADGYRAKFAASIEDGEEANRVIVDALVAKHLASVAGSDEDRRRSLRANRAKVWGIQDARMDAAIKGRGPESPMIEIVHLPWMQRIGERVETPRKPRWLARGGVLAFQADRGFELMGGWILDGQHWLDPAKDRRSDQLRCYGFS